jgi:hypothetical protein
MSQENISASIDEKIAASLKNVLATIARLLHAATQQLKIANQGRRRKHPRPGKAFQNEGAISLALRIGEKREGPAPFFLIGCKHLRLGERNHQHRDTAPVEFGFSFRHLAEVRLARQSGQVAEKNQQRVIADAIGEFHRLAAEIEHGKSIERDSFH